MQEPRPAGTDPVNKIWPRIISSLSAPELLTLPGGSPGWVASATRAGTDPENPEDPARHALDGNIT